MSRYLGLRRASTLLLVSLLLLTAYWSPLRSTDAQALWYSHVRTDGNSVVWFAYERTDNSRWHMCWASIDQQDIFDCIADVSSGDTSAGRLIWIQDGKLRGLDLQTGIRLELPSATGHGEDAQPALSGDRLVWVNREAPNSPWRILTIDLASSDLPKVVFTLANTGRLPRPAVSENRIVWDNWPPPENANSPLSPWELWMAEVGSEPVRLRSGFSGPGYTGKVPITSYDIGGDFIVYTIGYYNATAIDVRNPDQDHYLYHDGSGASTDGRYVFWEDTASVYNPELRPIIGYDLQTKSYIYAPLTLETHLSSMWTDGGIVAGVSGDREGVLTFSIHNLLPTAPLPPGLEDAKQTYYPETGHYLGWGFRDYWTANGGLAVFGYPMTGEFLEINADTGDTYTVQFTERQRFEWHPEKVGTPYEVLLGRLGSELLTMQARDWITFPKADPVSPHYFAESGHAIAPEFWSYWSSHGLEFGDPGVTFRESLALFGYPLSEPMIETNSDGHTVLTQYFERAVFEYHPNNHDPYKVLLRRLGVEMFDERGW